MPTLILHNRAQALVLEYALSTAADNERDKGEEGLGSEATSALEACCLALRAVLDADLSGEVPVVLDLMSWAAASRYLGAIEGGWESVEGLSPEAFEQARCALVAAFTRLDVEVVPVVPAVSDSPTSDRPGRFLGWLFRRNADGSVGIFAPPPRLGESQRTSDCIGPGQRDLHELLGKLADHMALADQSHRKPSDDLALAREAECLDEAHYGSVWAERLCRFADLVRADDRSPQLPQAAAERAA
jgi:hypothetical protein